MSENWLAVASAEHVRYGRQLGIMQVCHGKATPLRRIKPGDYIIYYSPTVMFRGKDRFQRFTAIGTVNHGEPYQVNVGEGFSPFRRDVTWCAAGEVPISSLLDVLDFTSGRKNWGYRLRFGLVQISEHDRLAIAYAMNASLETI
jgi:hypothetical protein